MKQENTLGEKELKKAIGGTPGENSISGHDGAAGRFVQSILGAIGIGK